MQHLRVLKPVQPDAFVIHGDADAGHTAGGIDPVDLSVPRILHRVSFVPTQQLDQQIVEKVGAGADENVVGIHIHGPEGVKMIRDGLPQGGDALIMQGQQQLFTVIQHHFPLQLAPDGEGKFLRAAAGQVQHRRSGLLLRCGGKGRGVDRGLGDILHEIADFFRGADITFRKQLVVSRFHGNFADLQILRQCPFGGQLLPRFQIAGENIGADAPVKRFIERHSGGFFQFVG